MPSRPTSRATGTPSPTRRATWERHVEALERIRVAEGLERVALVGHDWGGLIGLRWACDHPDALWAVVAADTGFFADGKWHGLADVMRAPGQGEELVDGMTRESFGQMLGAVSSRHRRRGGRTSTSRRSPTSRAGAGSSSSTAAATSRSWSPTRASSRPSASRSWRCGARTTRSRRWPAVGGSPTRSRAASSSVIPGTGHFVFEDAPEEAAEALASFLAKVAPR